MELLPRKKSNAAAIHPFPMSANFVRWETKEFCKDHMCRVIPLINVECIDGGVHLKKPEKSLMQSIVRCRLATCGVVSCELACKQIKLAKETSFLCVNA